MSDPGPNPYSIEGQIQGSADFLHKAMDGTARRSPVESFLAVIVIVALALPLVLGILGNVVMSLGGN